MSYGGIGLFMKQPERSDEVQNGERDDALAPSVGLVYGAMFSFATWLVLAAVVRAAYQSTPSWVAATVETVLLAARRAVS